MKKRLVFAAVLLFLAIAGALGWQLWGPSTQPVGQPSLITITSENYARLQTSFNQAATGVRVVALLSPT